jgi:serine/threonine protein kinase
VYEVVSILGEGGMGRVFLARDTKLHRDVALKVLPDSFATDRDRLARFDREAQVLASLNHPHIAHLYGVEEASATTLGETSAVRQTRALVMELVNGPTLAERLDAGPIPVNEALAIARQIADALEAAHEQSVIHRDLKPANIKVRDDGVVKVLDFGLAKALDPVGVSGADAANSPTFTSSGTQAGMILGTAAYMSPEQAKGKPVDKRADIWAFGVVLYEMLAGRRLFLRENVSETLARVILHEPEWGALPETTPRRIRELLRRCLVRDPRGRLRDMGEARIALDDAQVPDEPVVPAAPPPVSRRREILLAAIAGLAVLTAAALFIKVGRTPAEPGQPVRFEVLPLPGTSVENAVVSRRGVALSPDGRQIAFSTTAPSRAIFIRDIDSTTPRLLAGTEAQSGPPPSFFWSADGQFIAFFADNKLKKIPAAGGVAQVLCALPPGLGYNGTWNDDGVILFGAYGPASVAIWRVSGAGGEPARVYDVDPAAAEEVSDPWFLPDGRHFLALQTSRDKPDATFVGLLGSKERRILPGVASPAVYASAGYLLFVRGATLVAQAFDASTFELKGDVFPIVEGPAGVGLAPFQFSASKTGAIAYLVAPSLAESPLIWFDRTGKELRRETMSGNVQAPTLSRDGRRLVVERTDPAGTDLWAIDLERGVRTRVTDDPASDIRPVLSADGSRVAFGRGDFIWVKAASGAGAEERIVEGEVTDWSPDGKYLAFIRNGALWAVPLDGERKPIQLVDTKGNDRRGRFSPDGKWLSYESNYSGRFEVYVEPFPTTGERVQISVDGGGSAYWRRAGKELYYVDDTDAIMTVEVTPGATFKAGVPRRLFNAPGIINNGRFAVSPDGQQFLMPIQPGTVSPITVVLNWANGLKKE